MVRIFNERRRRETLHGRRRSRVALRCESRTAFTAITCPIDRAGLHGALASSTATKSASFARCGCRQIARRSLKCPSPQHSRYCTARPDRRPHAMPVNSDRPLGVQNLCKPLNTRRTPGLSQVSGLFSTGFPQPPRKSVLASDLHGTGHLCHLAAFKDFSRPRLFHRQTQRSRGHSLRSSPRLGIDPRIPDFPQSGEGKTPLQVKE